MRACGWKCQEGLTKRKPCEDSIHTCDALTTEDTYDFFPSAPTQNGTVEIKPICIDERTRLEAYLEPKDPANANKLDLYLLKEIKGKRAPKFDFEGNEGWKMVAYKFKPNPKHGFLRLARHRRPGCYMWAVSCKPGMDCNFDYDFYHNME